MTVTRRHFVTRVLPGAVLGLALRPAVASAGASFVHGVASGDPSPTGVLIWTRVTPSKDAEVEVVCQVAHDPAFDAVVLSGKTSTSAARDYTVKVEVEGLDPGEDYFYRFDALGAVSQTGRTRTLPVGARALHRESVPGHEFVSLEDYRARHAQYRSDPDLQAAHARHPFIVAWDDHESANDSWTGGAENHDASQGDWFARRDASVQAYYEWMPIRESNLMLHSRGSAYPSARTRGTVTMPSGNGCAIASATPARARWSSAAIRMRPGPWTCWTRQHKSPQPSSSAQRRSARQVTPRC